MILFVTDMKKILVLLLFTVAFAPVYAQRNLKWFSGKTPDEIIRIYGEPLEKDLEGAEHMVDCYLRYNSFVISMNNSFESNYSVESFATNSSDFVVIPEVLDGGIQVGGSFSKLQAVDFSSTKYGRGKPGNRLKPFHCSFGFQENDEKYVIYEEEFVQIWISVSNGVITGWCYLQQQDCPYIPYDFSNRLL